MTRAQKRHSTQTKTGSIAPSKPYNTGEWTESRFNSFIKSALRQASVRWPPRYQVLKEARIERGIYLCAGYKRQAHQVPASLPPPPGKKRRLSNTNIDHIDPVIATDTGFTSWDDVISRMFCEKDGLQLLCHHCHTAKTQDEREQRKKGK